MKVTWNRLSPPPLTPDERAYSSPEDYSALSLFPESEGEASILRDLMAVAQEYTQLNTFIVLSLARTFSASNRGADGNPRGLKLSLVPSTAIPELLELMPAGQPTPTQGPPPPADSPTPPPQQSEN